MILEYRRMGLTQIAETLHISHKRVFQRNYLNLNLYDDKKIQSVT